MKVFNGLGHPVWYQGSRMILIQDGESEVPDEIVLELGKAEGQMKQWVDGGQIRITSTEALDTDTLDEKPKGKIKKG